MQAPSTDFAPVCDQIDGTGSPCTRQRATRQEPRFSFSLVPRAAACELRCVQENGMRIRIVIGALAAAMLAGGWTFPGDRQGAYCHQTRDYENCGYPSLQ